MSKTINLTRLFSLSHSMLKQQLDYQVINGIHYKNDLQICAIFKYDYIDLKKKKYNESSDKEYILGLFKKGTREYIELPLKHKKTEKFESFELPLKFDNNLYNELKIFLEIDQSKHGDFHPWHFFKALNGVQPRYV